MSGTEVGYRGTRAVTTGHGPLWSRKDLRTTRALRPMGRCGRYCSSLSSYALPTIWCYAIGCVCCYALARRRAVRSAGLRSASFSHKESTCPRSEPRV
eukprot:3091023-Rhodomonas_salina.2